MYNSVHEENGKWYFWDETKADRYGPYNSEKEANEMLDKYCKHLHSGSDSDAS